MVAARYFTQLAKLEGNRTGVTSLSHFDVMSPPFPASVVGAAIGPLKISGWCSWHGLPSPAQFFVVRIQQWYAMVTSSSVSSIYSHHDKWVAIIRNTNIEECDRVQHCSAPTKRCRDTYLVISTESRLVVLLLVDTPPPWFLTENKGWMIRSKTAKSSNYVFSWSWDKTCSRATRLWADPKRRFKPKDA